MIFVDTDILIDVASADPQWMDWSIDALANASRRGPLVINAIVFAEFSLGFANEAACDAEIDRFGLRFLDRAEKAASLARRHRLPRLPPKRRQTHERPAGLLHRRACERTGTFQSAHARRRTLCATYFPEVELISP